MVDVKKFSEIDLYGLLEIDSSAQEAEIRKAYRKKALSCHPDKNPDNPKAAELFQELSKALEVLLDTIARAAYDRMQNAKKSAETRHRQLDAKRQKLKSDLEERERRAREGQRSAGGYSAKPKTPEEQFQEELDRLRREGNRMVEEEQELMRKQLQQDLQLRLVKTQTWDSSKHRVKIKWKAEKGDSSNGGYDEAKLRHYLKKYGELVALVMSPKKCGSAMVEFKNQQMAEMAVKFEKGNLQNPLTLEWLGEMPSKKPKTSSTIEDADFESVVARQMRQAEERRRLIEQMMKEDQESGNK